MVLLEVIAAMPVFAVTSLFTWLGYCQIRNYLHYKRSGCNVPFMPERPFLGSFRFMEPHLRDKEVRDKIGVIAYTTLLSEPVIRVADPELVHLVLAKENFPKSKIYTNLALFWGDNLVTFQHGEGNPWKEHRALVNPAFKLSSIRAMSKIFAEHSVAFAKRFLDHAENHPGVSFDFEDEINKLTIDIISSAGFNHDLGAFSGIGKKNPFLGALQEIIACSSHPLLLIPMGGKVLRFLQRKNRRLLNETFNHVIEQRMEEQETGKKDTGRIPDLLDIMLQPGDDGRQLSKEEIRNELLIFYFAGHETTATVLSWTVFELGRNPEVYERLMEEIISVMGPSGGDIVPPTNEQLEQMPYLTMVLNETLRLYPPVTSIGRIISETFEYKGYIFPKGMTISPSTYLTHREESIWEEPSRFNPDRFSKENSEGRHLYAFFPFMAGPRICVGKNFFFFEAKSLMATMLRTVKIQLDETKANGQMSSRTGLLRPNAVWINVAKA